MDLVTLALAVGVILLLLYLAVMNLTSWSVQHTFREMGIDTPPSSFFYGNIADAEELGIWVAQKKFHDMFPGKKVYGWYDFRTPIIVVRDLDLLKDIMVKHAVNFTNRRNMNEFDPPFMENLLTLRDDDWKRVRHTVSPTFSSGRLKKMLHHVDKNTKTLIKVMNQKCERNEEFELKALMSKFAMDTVGNTAYGLEVDTLQNEDSEFDREAKNFIHPNATAFAINLTLPKFGRLLKMFGYSVTNKQASAFFAKVTASALEFRKDSGSAGKMNDFIDLALNAEKEAGEKRLTRSEIYGMAILFLIAGYDTTSSTLSFTLFLLANHPEYQRKAQEELDEKWSSKTETVPSYDTVQTLTYLDQCISEAMRLHPPVAIVDRTCTEDVTLHGIKFTKGQIVTIPIYAIHNDPEVWDEPMKYRPDRFDPAQKDVRHPLAFLPFGHGPRSCIGMRLGLLEVKTVIASVLRQFDVVPCDKTVYPIKLDKVQAYAQDGMWVKLERRSKR